MSNAERFTSLLTEQYRDLFATDPEYAYSATRTTPEALAAKMTAALQRGSGNKDGRGIQRTCKALGIPYTYTAIRSFLK